MKSRGVILIDYDQRDSGDTRNPGQPYTLEDMGDDAAALIKALGIDGAISIELEYSPEPSKITEWVDEAYTATDRLMRQVGLRG